MGLDIITDGCYTTISNDERGRGLRINVFKMKSGTYRAFTSYLHDKKELATGFGESEDDIEAIKLSKESLKEEWKIVYG